MDLQQGIDFLSRFTHILTAITLMGGSAFMLFVLIPSADQLSPEAHDKLRDLVKGRWKRFIHVGILLFLVTGFYNYFRAMPNHKGDGLYHALIGTKIILALVVFFIASALVGSSAKLEFIRKSRVFWLRMLVAIACVIVAFSSFVKVRSNPKAVSAPASVGYKALDYQVGSQPLR